MSIPYGQRFIDVDLASASDILQQGHAYDPNFDQPAINAPPTPDITAFELYINNIFVNPEIHDIFIKRIGFSLIRVHRIQVTRVNKTDDNILLQQMKWPVETLYVGLRPVQNIDNTTPLALTAWHLYSYVQQKSAALCCLSNGWAWNAPLIALPAGITAGQYFANFNSFSNIGLDFVGALTALGYVGINAASVLTVAQLNDALVFNGFEPIPLGTPTAPNFPGALATAPTGASLGAAAALPSVTCEVSYQTQSPTIDRMNLEAHGVPLYRDIPSAFFRDYLSYTFGGQNILAIKMLKVH